MKKRLSLLLLQNITKFVLEIHNPKVILISGTIGKTSTKDAIFEFLSRKYKVRKTEDNSNNEFGVLYTILGISQDDNLFEKLFKALKAIFSLPEVLVIEVGSRKPGDIHNAINFLKADVTVITKISQIPSHIEFFKNLEEQAKEEFSIVDSLKEEGRVVCFESDVKYLDKKISVTTVSEGDVCSDFVYDEDGKIKGCNYKLNGENFYCNGSASSSYGFSLLFAWNVLKLVEGDVGLKVTKGRGKIIEGVNGSIIIDDTYNASPDSMQLALEDLRRIKCKGRKIVVIGEMLELGSYSKDAHRSVSALAKEITNEVYSVGNAFNGLTNRSFKNSREGGDFLSNKLSDGDVVLIKGSQANRLEITTQLLSKNPKSVVQNLVRQTKFWKNKHSVIFARDNVPFYDQNILQNWKEKGFNDEGEAHCWNKKTCGISCLKMVIESFGKEKISIGSITRELASKGAYKNKIGWIHSKIARYISEKFNLKSKSKRNVYIKDIRKILENGGLVIASVGFGFNGRKSGHLIVILGCEVINGKAEGFYVHHPSTRKDFCMERQYIPIKKFLNSFSGNIIKINE